MEEAQKRLEEAKKDGAMKEQEEAIRELEQAKAELEEILRQLRVEELARLLEHWNDVSRKCSVNRRRCTATRKVCTPLQLASRGKGEEIESGRLSREEGIILVDADKALSILKEEGSAVAFSAQRRTNARTTSHKPSIYSRRSRSRVDARHRGRTLSRRSKS